MNQIKIAIVDDETLFRDGINLVLQRFDRVEVVLEANNGQEFLDKLKVATILPDIVLLDLKMPVLNGSETAKILTKDFPNIKIIVLSTYFSKAFVYNMVEIGAAAYLPKNASREDVELTIHTVADSGFYYSEDVIKILRDSIRDKEKSRRLSFEINVTPREKEILQLICEQNTNAEIAKKLFVSARTVDGHRMNLLQKLNCRNTAGLVAFAIQNQLVRIDPSQFWM